MTDPQLKQDVKEIKTAVTKELVPAVTGKPSRAKKLSATGASLQEVASAMKKDPTLTLDQATKQGKASAAKRDRKQYGIGGKAKSDFLEGALGKGVGGFLSNLIDSRENRQARKAAANEADLPNVFEQGSKGKRSFLHGLLGEGLGGVVARATTSNKTKQAALDQYQAILSKREEAAQMSKVPGGGKGFSRNNVVQFPKTVTKAPPQHKEASQALMSLGYSKSEVAERLKNAPEGATTEQLVKHGLNPNVSAIPKAQVGAEASKLIQQNAASIGKSEDATKVDKERSAHEKKVDAELKAIKDEVDGLEGGNLLDKFLKALMALPLFTMLGSVLPKVAEILGKAGLVAIAGIIGFEVGKWIDNKFGIHQKVDKVVQGIQEYNKQQGINEDYADDIAAGRPTTREAAIKKGYKSWYEGGDRDSAQFLNPKEEQQSIQLGNTKLEDGEPKKKLLEQKQQTPPAVQPKAASTQADKIAAVSKDQQDLDDDKEDQTNQDIKDTVTATGAATAQVAVNASKQSAQMIAPSGGSSQPPLVIRVRNDESTAASYIAQLFDHPATFGGGSRM